MSEAERRPVDISGGEYSLKSITLDDLKVATEYFHFPHPKKVNVAFSVSQVEEYPGLRVTSIKVELANDEEEVVATIECAFKVDFVFDDAEAEISDDFSDELNLIATRMSYPYHRQFISDIVSRMGLRPTFLPAVPDVLWDQDEIVGKRSDQKV